MEKRGRGRPKGTGQGKKKVPVTVMLTVEMVELCGGDEKIREEIIKFYEAKRTHIRNYKG